MFLITLKIQILNVLPLREITAIHGAFVTTFKWISKTDKYTSH